MRALVRGRLLWPYDGALPVAALQGLVDAPPSVVSGALAHLRDEGVVSVDRDNDTVQLTAAVVRELQTPALLH